MRNFLSTFKEVLIPKLSNLFCQVIILCMCFETCCVMIKVNKQSLNKMEFLWLLASFSCLFLKLYL